MRFITNIPASLLTTFILVPVMFTAGEMSSAEGVTCPGVMIDLFDSFGYVFLSRGVVKSSQLQDFR